MTTHSHVITQIQKVTFQVCPPISELYLTADVIQHYWIDDVKVQGWNPHVNLHVVKLISSSGRPQQQLTHTSLTFNCTGRLQLCSLSWLQRTDDIWWVSGNCCRSIDDIIELIRKLMDWYCQKGSQGISLHYFDQSLDLAQYRKVWRSTVAQIYE